MPHIIFKKKDLISTPSTIDGIDFEFVAKSFNFTSKPRKTEYKISVRDDKNNKNFLLTLKNKDDDFLLKADKATRVTPVDIVKNALNSYVTLNNSEILSSNTSNLKDIKDEEEHKYLKDISYFVYDFKTEKEIQIEVGFGSGRHLIHQAKMNPSVQFIGLEIHTPSIEQVLKQLELQNVTNVLIINYDARLFMEFIDSNSVGKIFVHFPVPWDKKPHRRVYSKDFVDEALRVLKIDGSLELRTDSRKYFDYCLDLLTNLPKGNITIDINKELEVSSKYEDRWKKMGKNIYDLVLKAYSNDQEKELNPDFNFDFEINFDEKIKKIPTTAIIEKNFFVHIVEIYTIENRANCGLLKVTMGSFDKPVNKYLITLDGKTKYYQGEPIPTSSNINAHNKLKEILKKND